MNIANELNKDGFSQIYLAYYSKLICFAKEYVVSAADAENIVQDMFLFLWENKGILPTIMNLRTYLFTLIKNRCIDFLRVKINERRRYETIQNSFEMELKLKLNSLEFFDAYGLSDEPIEKIINEAIDSLPGKCREIFVMSRFDNLRHKEIAEKLHISPNTVENQIRIATKKLRIKLKKYFPLFFFIIC